MAYCVIVGHLLCGPKFTQNIDLNERIFINVFRLNMPQGMEWNWGGMKVCPLFLLFEKQ